MLSSFLRYCVIPLLVSRRNPTLHKLTPPAATTTGAFYVPLQSTSSFYFLCLLYIFQSLIHRNLLDSLEIKYHNNQISDQHKSKHFCITNRCYAKSEPAAVGKEHHPPCRGHNKCSKNHTDEIRDYNHNTRRKQIQTRDLFVFVSKDFVMEIAFSFFSIISFVRR